MQLIVLKEEEYITACYRVTDDAHGRLILHTKERARYVTLTDTDGNEYGEVSNFCEPLNFRVHVFYLPDAALAAPLIVRFLNYEKQDSAFFASFLDAGQTCLSPENITETDRTAFIEESDHGITVESESEYPICEGLTRKMLICRNATGAPVRVGLLMVDPEKVGFAVGTAGDSDTPGEEVATVLAQAEAAMKNGRRVLAATNADFFNMFENKAPSGPCVKGGKCIANPCVLTPFFGIDRAGKPVISSFAEAPALQGQLSCAVGGREIFLRDGELSELSVGEPFSYECHPRTAVGIRADGMVLLMTVDGRRPEFSNGASVVDLARLMQRLGALHAINLDGGGSSTLLAQEDGALRLFNRPADLFRPMEDLIRPVYNSIQIVEK